MPGTTTNYKIPYALPTEPVKDGATVSQMAAERVEFVLPTVVTSGPAFGSAWAITNKLRVYTVRIAMTSNQFGQISFPLAGTGLSGYSYVGVQAIGSNANAVLFTLDDVNSNIANPVFWVYSPAGAALPNRTMSIVATVIGW